MFELTNHKGYANAAKAEQQAEAKHRELYTQAQQARQALTAVLEEAKESRIPPDVVQREELEHAVAQAAREEALARRDLEAARKARAAAQVAAVAELQPQYTQNYQSTLARIAEAGTELRDAIDELNAIEHAWAQVTNATGARRADPTPETRRAFEALHRGRPTPKVGAQFDQLAATHGRRLHAVTESDAA